MLISFVIKYGDDDEINLKKCLKAIFSQPKKNYEVFVLIKSSEEDIIISDSFLEEYKFTIIYQENNTEINILRQILDCAKGKFVHIMDYRDSISIDWCYEIEKNTSKELIIGRQIYKKDEFLFEYNLSPVKYFPNELSLDDFLKCYFNHGGEDKNLIKINNKAIKKDVLSKALYLMDKEDIETDLFYDYLNIICLNLVSDITLAQHSSFIYCLSQEENLYSASYKSIIKAYSLFIDKLIDIVSDSNIEVFDEWEKDWWRNLANELYEHDNSSIEDILHSIQEESGEYFNPINTTGFFRKLETKLEYGYIYEQEVKSFIASDYCQIVGFDIFDTLIQRPFWEPIDLFFLLNAEYNRLIAKDTVIDFSLIRKEGESACRAYYFSVRPGNEDVSIDEIYDYISLTYGIELEIAKKIKDYEIDLEKKFCEARESGRILYDWAKYCKKKIYIISDMYLDKDTIEYILKKNGYSSYEKLYLSNEKGLSKYSGNLFSLFKKEEQIKNPERVCFIGDNYQVDFVNAKRSGFVAFHIPKATDIFKGENNAIYAGDFYKKIYLPNGGIIDQGTVLKYIGIRCMMGLVANKFFGNPFVSVNIDSDFNADLRLIGYYCAGTFLYSEAKWLLGETKRRGINTIHFIARDGYYVKEAYDLIKGSLKEGAESNYLYFSRKSVAPLYLSEPEGIYELFLPPHIYTNTPQKIVGLLKPVLKDGIDVDVILRNNGIISQRKFGSLNEYYIFAKCFISELYDKEKANKNKEKLQEYFKDIVSKDDVIFDVGYSGRIETALTKLLGYPINSFYFHEHEPWALMRKHNIGFSIDSFYSFKPCSAFVVREEIFTPSQPSCVGFVEESGTMVPKFEKYSTTYKKRFVLENIQKWAIMFVEDMVRIFDGHLSELYFNKFDACIPFEYYLQFSEEFDRFVMAAVDFEDEFGTNDVLSVFDYWNNERFAYNLYCGNDDKSIKQRLRNEMYREEGIFPDGAFMKLYRKINKMLPVGSKRRDFVKGIFMVGK